jgi:adenosylcobyric acid synthase
MLADVKLGDVVLIQFGHNDAGAINQEPPGSRRPLRARASLPGLGEEQQEIDNVVTKKHEVVHTFSWYQRLGEQVSDPAGVAGDAGDEPGLELLPVKTEFAGQKLLHQVTVECGGRHWSAYEIHMGRAVFFTWWTR